MSSDKGENEKVLVEIDAAEGIAEVTDMNQNFMNFYKRQRSDKVDGNSSKENVGSKKSSGSSMNREEAIEVNSEYTEKLLHEIMNSSDENDGLALNRQSDESVHTEKNYGYKNNVREDENETKRREQVEMEEERASEKEEVDDTGSITPLSKGVLHTDQNIEEHMLNSGAVDTFNECYFSGIETKQIKVVDSRGHSGESVFIEGDEVLMHKKGDEKESYNLNGSGIQYEKAPEDGSSWGERKKKKNFERAHVSKKRRGAKLNKNSRRRHSMKISSVTEVEGDIRKVQSLRTPDSSSEEQRSVLKESEYEEDEKEKVEEEVEEDEEECDVDDDDDDDVEEEEEDEDEDEEDWEKINKHVKRGTREKGQSEKRLETQVKYIYKNYSPAPIPQTEKTGYWFIDTINSALDKCCAINEKDYYLNNMDIVELYPNDETQYTYINEMLKVKWPDCFKWNQLIYYTHILNIYENIFRNLHKDEIQADVLMLQNKKRTQKSNEIPLPKFCHKNLKDRCILKNYEELPELKVMEERQRVLFHKKNTFFKEAWKSSRGKVEKKFAGFIDKCSDKLVNMGNSKVMDSLKEGTRSVVSNMQNADMFARLPRCITAFFDNIFSCIKYDKEDEIEIGEETLMRNFPLDPCVSNGEARIIYDKLEDEVLHKSKRSNLANITRKMDYNSGCFNSNALGNLYNSVDNINNDSNNNNNVSNSNNMNNNFISNTTDQTHNIYSNKVPLGRINTNTILYSDLKTNSIPRRSRTFNSMEFLTSNATHRDVFTPTKKKNKSRPYTFDELPKYTRSYANSRSKISSSFHSLDNENVDNDVNSAADLNMQHADITTNNNNNMQSKHVSSNDSIRRNCTDNAHPEKISSFSNFAERSVKSPINDNFYTVSSLSLDREKWESKAPFHSGMNADNQEFLECKSNLTPNCA